MGQRTGTKGKEEMFKKKGVASSSNSRGEDKNADFKQSILKATVEN